MICQFTGDTHVLYERKRESNMPDLIIINGAPDLIPELRLRLSKQGLSIPCCIGNLTIAEKEGTDRFSMEICDIQKMTREIQAVLRKYSGASAKHTEA